MIPGRDDLIKENPRVVSTSRESIYVLVGKGANVSEASASVSITQAELAVSVASTGVNVPCLSQY